MRINTNSVSFNSKIKLITPSQFNKQLTEFKEPAKEVTYPWTIETLKTGNTLFTTKILDCIAICLTNGKTSLLAHLGIRNREEAKRDNVKEFDIDNIENKIVQELDFKDKNLHAIIFGGMQCSDDPNSGNTPKLNQLKILFDKYKISYSIIGARKDVHFFGRYSLLFNQNEDTLYITNTHFNSDGICGKCNHKEMELNFDNKVDYNIYQKTFDNNGSASYHKKRVRTSIETYFKSQFRQVKLNKYDKFD